MHPAGSVDQIAEHRIERLVFFEDQHDVLDAVARAAASERRDDAVRLRSARDARRAQRSIRISDEILFGEIDALERRGNLGSVGTRSLGVYDVERAVVIRKRERKRVVAGWNQSEAA